MRIEVGCTYRVPSWKWIPTKMVTVVYKRHDDVCIKIVGERGLQVVDVPATDDWEIVQQSEMDALQP